MAVAQDLGDVLGRARQDDEQGHPAVGRQCIRFIGPASVLVQNQAVPANEPGETLRNQSTAADHAGVGLVEDLIASFEASARRRPLNLVHLE